MDRHQDLLTPFTIAEIESGLAPLANGKSPGYLGFPSELFRYARDPTPPGGRLGDHLLSPILKDIFNMAFKQETIPSEAYLCLVTPVFKKGAPTRVNTTLLRLGIRL
jgi:hypothetical protein